MNDNEYIRLYCKERRRARKAAGVCVGCGKEASLAGRTLGADCKKKSDQYYRRKNDRNENARVC